MIFLSRLVSQLRCQIEPWQRFWFMWFRRRLLSQIDDYAKWKSKYTSLGATSDREYLLKFAEVTKARDVTEIDPEEAEAFGEMILYERTFYSSIHATKAVRNLLRYYRARGYPCADPAQIGK